MASFEPDDFDLRIYLGEVVRLLFTFTHRVKSSYPPVDEPFPLAGYTITAVFKQAEPLVLSDGSGLVVDTAADTVALTLLPEQTYLIQKTSGWYLQAVTADGEDGGYLIRGTVQVKAP